MDHRQAGLDHGKSKIPCLLWKNPPSRLCFTGKKDPLLMDLEPLSASDRCKVCCAGSTISQVAFVVCGFLLIAGWCVFGGDYFWTQRHELPPYRFRFVHFVPGLLMSCATMFIVFASVAEDNEQPDPFGDHSRRRYNCSIIWAVFCMCCCIVPLAIAAATFHATWYDPTSLGTIPPSHTNNDTVHSDEGLQRGLFSSISGKVKTTPPPTTVPPPSTWPPFEGPDAVPGLYVLHIVLLMGSLGMSLLAKMWKSQERDRAQQAGESSF